MAHVALGVTGSIAAYKSVEVARGLLKNGHEVTVVMTPAAQRFVGALTFEAITRRAVVTDQFAVGLNAAIEHVALASAIDVLVMAPATADVIGKCAAGVADDFLTSLYLATRAPVVVAPAMNTNMLRHPAVQANLELLAARGVRVVDSEDGDLACGWTGPGRLAEPAAIIAATEAALRPHGSLLGRCVVVTAGPTYEDLDPVRFLGNRASGRMGFALGKEAARRGASVVLVAGPTALAPPVEVELVSVRSAAEMHEAVMARAGEADAMILAAAVADYTPSDERQDQKQSKQDGPRTLTLARTRDILADLGAWRDARPLPVLVGFAAETQDLVPRARRKLKSKRVDLIVANDVSRSDSGFAVDVNEATLVTLDADEALPRQPKAELAGVVLDRVERMLTGRPSLAIG